MKLSLLKQKLIDYHRNKGWGKKSQIIPDHDEIVWLDVYIETLSNDHTVTEDSDILFENFKSFATRHSPDKNLFTEDYLNSVCMSSSLFRSWILSDTISNTILPRLNIIHDLQQIQFAHLKKSVLDSVNLQINIPQINIPEINISQQISYTITSHWSKSTLFDDVERYHEQNMRLKNVDDYNSHLLLLLGQEFLLNLNLVNASQLQIETYKLTFIEMGKAIIHSLKNQTIIISDIVLESIALLVERKISSSSAYSLKFDKTMDTFYKENILEYIINSVHKDPIIPFVIILEVTEQIDSTGIGNVRDYLHKEITNKNLSGKKLGFMIIERLNTADNIIHRAEQQHVHRVTP